MAEIYKLTQTELRFLLMFAEKRGMYGFEEMPLIEEEAEAGECVRSLCGKGILKADEEQKYEMDKTLELLLEIFITHIIVLLLHNDRIGKDFSHVIRCDISHIVKGCHALLLHLLEFLKNIF